MPRTNEEKLKARNAIIIVLSIVTALLIGAIFYLWKKSNQLEFAARRTAKIGFIIPSPVLPVDDSVALDHIKNYRGQRTASKGRGGIWFTFKDYKNYIDSTFKTITDRKMPLSPNEEWTIGFYWMEENMPGSSDDELYDSFLMIPTIADTADPKNPIVYDYFDPKWKAKYRDKPSTNNTTAASGNVYNNGQLWP